MLDRRDLLKLSALGAATALSGPRRAFAQVKNKPQTRIVFLGTKGGPRVETGRSNPANLIEVGNTRIVLDCGMGVSHQLAEAHVPLTTIKYILISHHHSDHNLEYGNLVYNAWATGLSTPIHAFGPKGLEAMTKTYWELNKFDVETRIGDEGRPDPRKLLIAKDEHEMFDPGTPHDPEVRGVERLHCTAADFRAAGRSRRQDRDVTHYLSSPGVDYRSCVDASGGLT